MTTKTDSEKIKAIGKILIDESRPLKERFRALFTLKNIGGVESIACIKEGFKDPSALLKHELAYCLGQMQDSNANPVLIEVLKDVNQEPMVRHEAGEALGAIGDENVIPLLEEYSNDPVIEVAETCQLALERIKWFKSGNSTENLSQNPFASVDPAPPDESDNVEDLKKILLDESQSLFKRYRAMFSLRNLNNNESALALAEGLLIAKSALMRHEVAFVLGQLRNEITISYLRKNLQFLKENEMVRHECAEALGSIAHPFCQEVLNDFLTDEKRVVRESCMIALDMCEYENSTEFQYADTLSKIPHC